ncbi:MAG: nucleotide-binding protein [Methanomicrobiales archaeon]|nr:nucleotide-binding protein [Methanomicrobiales archaeon]
MKAVLDASFFFAEYAAEGELYTTPSVIDEIRDTASLCRLERRTVEGLVIREAQSPFQESVRSYASRTGDSRRLSPADVDVLAVALELGASVYTDDFSIENVAHALAIPVISLREREARPVRWKFRCSGCGRYARSEGECPICGAAVKRKRN